MLLYPLTKELAVTTETTLIDLLNLVEIQPGSLFMGTDKPNEFQRVLYLTTS